MTLKLMSSLSAQQMRHAAQRAAEVHPTVDALRAAVHDDILPKARSLWPHRVWKTLQLSRHVDLHMLHDEQLSDATDGWAPDCTACADHCCRGEGAVIRLRLLDVAHLVDAGLTSAIDVSIDDDPRLTEKRFPKLKKKADGNCVFFDDGECVVHPIKPLRCQRFPHRLSADKQSIAYANRCQSRRPGSDDELVQLRKAVVDNYNAKVVDLVALQHGQKVLKQLALDAHLPQPEGANAGGRAHPDDANR